MKIEITTGNKTDNFITELDAITNICREYQVSFNRLADLLVAENMEKYLGFDIEDISRNSPLRCVLKALGKHPLDIFLYYVHKKVAEYVKHNMKENDKIQSHNIDAVKKILTDTHKEHNPDELNELKSTIFNTLPASDIVKIIHVVANNKKLAHLKQIDLTITMECCGEEYQFKKKSIEFPDNVDDLDELGKLEPLLNQDILLEVKNANYLGGGDWKVKYNNKQHPCSIEDEEFLKKFQSQAINGPLPKDILMVTADIYRKYKLTSKIKKEEFVKIVVKKVKTIEKAKSNEQINLMDDLPVQHTPK